MGPSGMHDDCVMSLALTAWGVRQRDDGIIRFYEKKIGEMYAAQGLSEEEIEKKMARTA